MTNLSETNLAEPIVKALRKHNIVSVEQLMSKTGAEIREMMPGYYHQINAFVCNYDPPKQTKKPRIGAPARRRERSPYSPGKLNSDEVLLIRKLYNAKNVTILELAKEFGVARTTIHNVVNGISWRHLV